MSALLGSSKSPLLDCRLLICILMQLREGRLVLWPLLIKALIPFRKVLLSWPVSKRPHLQIRWHWESDCKMLILEGCKRSVHNMWLPEMEWQLMLLLPFAKPMPCAGHCAIFHVLHLFRPPNLCELGSVIISILLLKSKTEGHRGCHFPLKPKSSASDPFAFNDWTVLSFSNHCYTIFQ